MHLKRLLLPLTSLLLMLAATSSAQVVPLDLLIYGGTSAGIAAGIQARRDGLSVLVLEPSAHIGGLTTGGLGQTDIGNKQVIGGISREFYRNIRAHYRAPANWTWQEPEAYTDDGQTRTDPNEDAKWTFEPSSARAKSWKPIPERTLPDNPSNSSS